jgi:catechol 2,3-dioxygenase-like lactoylglutathione lyase family enzyme
MITPVFLITDYPTALAFYVDWLGFRLDWEEQTGRSRVYVQLSRSGFVLHLSNSLADSSPGATVRVEGYGLPAYHRQLAKAVVPMLPTMGPAYWNDRVLEMSVTDPFGNRIIFCELGALKI